MTIPGQDSSGAIRIMAVIEKEVGTPRNDGTRGSALYSVPLRLSRRPPSGWAELFVHAWDNPREFTMRHRSGIASVSGDRIILNGTTIEEVAEVHKKTLVMAVEDANQQWAELDARRRESDARQARETEEHRRHVEDTAKRLRFDS